MALSKKFHWVEVNRDHTPAIPKKFGVNAYPTLLTLGRADEKVHRVSGFKKPADFLPQLDDALRRFDLYRQGKEWDDPDPRPASICDEGTVEIIPAPSEGVPGGIAFLSGRIYVLQEKKLTWIGPGQQGVSEEAFEFEHLITGLCTEGTGGGPLYAIDYGWTAGDPIYLIDPRNGRIGRKIVTEANKKNRAKGAKGIAWRNGKLYALDGARGVIREIDPATGVVTRTIQTDARWLAGLTFDGKAFVAGSRDALYWFDPETGKTLRTLKLNYPVRTVGFFKGSYYLMEQPVFGHDKQHQRVRVWPRKTVIFKLTLEP